MTQFPQVVWFWDARKGGRGDDKKTFGTVIAWVYTSNDIEAVVRTFASNIPERFEHIKFDGVNPSSHIDYAEWKKEHEK